MNMAKWVCENYEITYGEVPSEGATSSPTRSPAPQAGAHPRGSQGLPASLSLSSLPVAHLPPEPATTPMVLLTFDIDDADPQWELAHALSLRLDQQGFHVVFSDRDDGQGRTIPALFPFQAGMDEMIDLLRKDYPSMMVAALGPSATPGESGIVFANQLPLQ